MIQSNWICKHTIEVEATAGVVNYEDKIPPGHLRAVMLRCGRSGSAAGLFHYRIPKAKIRPGYSGIAAGGFTDWISNQCDGIMSRADVFYFDLRSEGAIDIMYRPTADTLHQLQLSFWYEPGDGDDDSHLAPLAVTRGGQTR